MGLTSPVRWCGGKRWLAERLAKEIEAANPKRYFEPFLGGGAVALAVPSYIPKHLSDINPTLIDFWRCLQRAPSTLIEELARVKKQFPDTQKGYLDARDALNAIILDGRPFWIRRAALFMYINARCFNGLWRTNGIGKFNVPWGKLEKPSSIDLDEAKALSVWLRNVVLEAGDYAGCLAEIAWPKTTAIYADCPYDKMFDDYAKEDFGESQQRELAEHLRFWAGRGAKIWATNNDTPLVREIYSWAEIEALEEHHSVGAIGDRRGKRACLLIRS